MRWHLAEFGTKEEKRRKESTIVKIDAFFERFASDADKLIETFRLGQSESLQNWFEENLQSIDRKLMWEMGTDVFGNQAEALVVTITPEDNTELRPLVETMLKRAKPLPNWRFTQYRTPNTSTVSHSLARHNWNSAEGAIRFTEFNCFDLTIKADFIKKPNQEKDLQEVFYIAQSFLGEELLECWINLIFTEPKNLPLAPSILNKITGRKGNITAEDNQFMPMEELRQKLNLAIAELTDRLPPEPYWATPFEFIYSMKVPEPEVNRRFSVTTHMPSLFIAKGNRMLFQSRAFSRHDEKFCYLKMVKDPEFHQNLEWRYGLEEKLDEKLRKAQAGCMLGGGVGLDACYIDLILQDIPKSVEIIRSELMQAQAPENTWLLFHDADWKDEWVGLLDTTPPPAARYDRSW
ncbi:MAG: hypothetical protein JNN26_16900 [Candidatus Obscuribacter sp.]|nr:hypothetical protein [Candidatus Obscuribacter sp.]